ncbi:hypothetical protein OH77DRAFT_1035745 [Trametes cingulata]|nr:hypothetical protein OH77DRAFT_1035745 [Trametes cingulata]
MDSAQMGHNVAIPRGSLPNYGSCSGCAFMSPFSFLLARVNRTRKHGGTRKLPECARRNYATATKTRHCENDQANRTSDTNTEEQAKRDTIHLEITAR